MIDYREVDSGTMQPQPDPRMKPLGRPNSKLQLGKNFSYPRPDGHPIRHESTNSRSSVNSNGSLPGMTDSSDSETSADDDHFYNTSASELWDTFWSTGTSKTQHTVKLQSPATTEAQSSKPCSQDYYTKGRAVENEDDAVTITQSDQDSTDSKTPRWQMKISAQLPSQQTTRGAAGYSAYSEPTPLPTQITRQLPPRTSSLTPEHFLRPLNGSKSVANLNSRTSTHGLYLAPPSTGYETVSIQMQPSRAPARMNGTQLKLRPSVSAHNIREASRHNVTAPLVPVPVIPEQLRSAPPQIEHFVSVFDFDSDDESGGEHDTFAKRIARGLQHKKSLKEMSSKRGKGQTHRGHKKSASEKSALSPEKRAANFIERPSSLSRTRGGSLGRILGFKSNR